MESRIDLVFENMRLFLFEAVITSAMLYSNESGISKINSALTVD